jgi:hypothetical protein
MSDTRRQDDAGGQEQEDRMAVEGIGRGNVIPIETLRRMHEARGKGDAAPPRPSGVDGEAGASRPPEEGSAVQRADEGGRLVEARPQTEDERARLIDRYKSETADLPEVRRDKVIEAKLRISTGYYNRDEVRREVLHSVLANLLPPPAENAPGKSEPAAEPGGPNPETAQTDGQ